MHKAITMCYRPSTDSVFQLEIPEDILEEAVLIGQRIDGDIDDDINHAMTSHLLKYIAKNTPNAGQWEIQLEPIFKIVNCDDDLDTSEDREDLTESIEKYWDSLDLEDKDNDDMYLGDTE